MTISQEAIEAFALAFWPVNAVSKMESCEGDIAKALEAALPFTSSPGKDGGQEVEAVAEWTYQIQYGPEGEADYAWVYRAQEMVATMKTHHARALCSALSVQPAAAVVGEPVYRFLVEGDVIEATDEFVADDSHGWQPPAAWAVGMEYPSRIFKPVRRRVAAPTATEGLDEQALDKAAREGYAVRCKTHGPRVLDHYASADIMQRQLDDARVIIAAYLSALAECSR